MDPRATLHGANLTNSVFAPKMIRGPQLLILAFSAAARLGLYRESLLETIDRFEGTRKMNSAIPSSMQALAVAEYATPSSYGVATLPVPTIMAPDQLIIRVHSAAINPVDVKMASGITKMMARDKYVEHPR